METLFSIYVDLIHSRIGEDMEIIDVNIDDIIKIFEEGLDVNYQRNKPDNFAFMIYTTPLFYAIRYNWLELVKWILIQGGNPYIKLNLDEHTYLNVTGIFYTTEEMYKLILENTKQSDILLENTYQKLEDMVDEYGHRINISKGINIKTKQEVVIKSSSVLSLDDEDSLVYEDGLSDTISEIYVMKKLKNKSPYLSILVDVYLEMGDIIIVIKYIPSIDIDDFTHFMDEDEYYLPDYNKLKYVMFRLLEALDTCHQNDIVHNDIKPTNILFDERKQIPILIDFGSSCFDKPQTEPFICADSCKLTSYPWESPEKIGRYFNNSSITLKKYFGEVEPFLLSEKDLDLKKSDIWSLGIVFYQYVYGIHPFIDMDSVSSVSQLSAYKDIMKGKFRRRYIEINDPIIDKVLELMLIRNPKYRPTAKELIHIFS